MRSKHKLAVTAKVFPQYGGKRWVAVEVLRGNRFVPSFEDIFRIVRGIVYCERDKYDTLRRDPGEMVKRFLVRCVERSSQDYEGAWKEIEKEFQVPDRCAPRPPTKSGGTVISLASRQRRPKT